MKFRVVLVAAVLALLASAGRGQASEPLRVSVDRIPATTKLGHDVDLRATITNTGGAPVRGLVAHLNVLSFDPGVYVDPEDWSSHRTRYLAPIPAGGSATVTWRINAVNPGSIGLYVAVLQSSGNAPPQTGPTVRLEIADRRTLDSGGILPLALGVPALLAGLALGITLRRRHWR